MSSCRLPRLQNVTRRATELSLDIFRERIPRSRLLFSEGQCPCRGYILVRFLFVCFFNFERV